jgi:hypothetical protein
MKQRLAEVLTKKKQDLSSRLLSRILRLKKRLAEVLTKLNGSAGAQELFFLGIQQLSKKTVLTPFFFPLQVLTTVNGCREALEQVQEEDQMALMYLTALKVLLY